MKSKGKRKRGREGERERQGERKGAEIRRVLVIGVWHCDEECERVCACVTEGEERERLCACVTEGEGTLWR